MSLDSWIIEAGPTDRDGQSQERRTQSLELPRLRPHVTRSRIHNAAGKHEQQTTLRSVVNGKLPSGSFDQVVEDIRLEGDLFGR